MRWLKKIKTPLALVGALLINIHVQAAEPSNNTILGAIPQSFDNIGIVRYADMDADTVVGAQFLRETRTPPGMQGPTDAMPLGHYIAERLNADGLAIAVQALSNQDVGAGMDYSARNTFRCMLPSKTLTR